MHIDKTLKQLDVQSDKAQHVRAMHCQLINKLHYDLLTELKKYIPTVTAFKHDGKSRWHFSSDAGEEWFRLKPSDLHKAFKGDTRLGHYMEIDDWNTVGLDRSTYQRLTEQFASVPAELQNAIAQADLQRKRMLVTYASLDLYAHVDEPVILQPVNSTSAELQR